ncbi:hypothetical protein [Clostridium botulinum]|uniref:hypothetical protein n=1 Tax=Clostridium botulinum TaxID=1491 RepID=UPI000AEA8B87|nr:hypothetical protein [Clostridium botulinum]
MLEAIVMLFAVIGVVAVIDVTAVVLASKGNNVEDDKKLNRPDLIELDKEE